MPGAGWEDAGEGEGGELAHGGKGVGGGARLGLGSWLRLHDAAMHTATNCHQLQTCHYQLPPTATNCHQLPMTEGMWPPRNKRSSAHPGRWCDMDVAVKIQNTLLAKQDASIKEVGLGQG